MMYELNSNSIRRSFAVKHIPSQCITSVWDRLCRTQYFLVGWYAPYLRLLHVEPLVALGEGPLEGEVGVRVGLQQALHGHQLAPRRPEHLLLLARAHRGVCSGQIVRRNVERLSEFSSKGSDRQLQV